MIRDDFAGPPPHHHGEPSMAGGASTPDYLSTACHASHHQSCPGYADDWSDPSLCDCTCHDNIEVWHRDGLSEAADNGGPS